MQHTRQAWTAAMSRGRPARLAQQLERVLRDERLAAGLVHGVRAQ